MNAALTVVSEEKNVKWSALASIISARFTVGRDDRGLQAHILRASHSQHDHAVAYLVVMKRASLGRAS